jgi:hypothetical protein
MKRAFFAMVAMSLIFLCSAVLPAQLLRIILNHFTNHRKGKVMKTLSLALLLTASLAFVLLGCSDNSALLPAPTEQALSTTTLPTALGKGGPIMHSATGNCGIVWEGKNVTFAFTAEKRADGSCSGEYQIYVHSQDPAWGKWHGKVTSLEVYGNKAVIGGVETQSTYSGYYDAFVVIDNGEGKNATPDMWTSTVFWDASLANAQAVWGMLPEEVVALIATNNSVTTAEILVPIQHGNIQVR